MKKIDVNVTIPQANLRKAINSIRAYDFATAAKVKRAIAKGAFAVQKDAKILAPVDTGRLRSSIKIDFFKGGLTADVNTNVEYAANVEFGSSRQRSSPYLFPAYEQNRAEIFKDLKEALEK